MPWTPDDDKHDDPVEWGPNAYGPLRELYEKVAGHPPDEWLLSEPKHLEAEICRELEHWLSKFLENTLRDGQRNLSHPLWALTRAVSDQYPRFALLCAMADLIKFTIKTGEESGQPRVVEDPSE